VSRRAGGGSLFVGIATASVLLVIAAGAFRSWIADRSAQRAARPVIEGRLEVAGLERPVEVSRDGEGWPHIHARTEGDAWLALGFVQAQDRLAQMLWLRRLAWGRTAERIGAPGLEADRLVRTVGIGALAEEETDHLAAGDRRVLDAYAAGVNARLERLRLRGAVPGSDGPEDDLGPWRAADSVAVYKLVSWASANSIDVSVTLSDLIQRLGGVGARPFFPTAGGVRGVRLPVDWPVDAPASGAAREPLRPQLLDVARLDGGAWIVPPAGLRPAPQLVAELTFGATVPPLIHSVHLAGGDLEVVGATVPGIPVFWSGRTRRTAWAAIPARAVATDLFMETLRGHGRSAYHDGVRWAPLAEREESIAVRGAEPETLRIRATHHGPLLDALLAPGREPLAVAWTGARPGTGPGALMGLPYAGTADEIEHTIERHRDPALDFAYADRDGARGVRIVGWLPRRVLPSSGVPVPGRMRAFNWYEPVASDQLPSLRADGRTRLDAPPLIAADEALPDGRGTGRVEYLWRRGVRAERIAQVLEQIAAASDESADIGAGGLTDELQPGVSEVVAAVRRLAPAGSSLGAGPAEMLSLLSEWDGRFAPASAGAVVYRTLLAHTVRDLFDPVLGTELLDRYRSLPGADPDLVAAAIVVAAAEADAPGSWADRARVAPAVAKALQETWMSVRYRLGPNRSRWSWGRLHQLIFRAFERPDLEVEPAGVLGSSAAPGGSRHTLRRTESDAAEFEVRRLSGYGMIADLSLDLAEADALRAALVPGNPEQPGEPGYAAGLDPWLRGDLHPWPERGELEADRVVRRLTLAPPP